MACFLLLCGFHNCGTYSELKTSPRDVNSHTPMAPQRFPSIQSRCGLLQTMGQTVRPSYQGLNVAATAPERTQSVGLGQRVQLKSRRLSCVRVTGVASLPQHLHLLITVQSQHSL